MELGFTVVKQKATPLIQALFTLVMGWLGMLIIHLINPGPAAEYFAAYVGLIFFSILNSVISVANKSYLRYTIPSYYIYVVLVVLLLLSARFISGISIWDLPEFRMMLLPISIFYFMVSTMVRAIRFLYELAESEH